MLTISPETVCRIVMKARAFDAKVAPNLSDPGSNPTDDNEAAVLADYGDDPVVQELSSAIEDLNADAQLDIIALTWLGRGDFDDWAEAREQAADTAGRNMPDYLLGIPLLATYLEEGLAQLGHSCQPFEQGHL
ncbi:MAG: DUF3775 domain-containing protein [Alphaproteobacteria bacterium]